MSRPSLLIDLIPHAVAAAVVVAIAVGVAWLRGTGVEIGLRIGAIGGLILLVPLGVSWWTLQAGSAVIRGVAWGGGWVRTRWWAAHTEDTG